jgi:hypothetical protein
VSIFAGFHILIAEGNSDIQPRRTTFYLANRYSATIHGIGVDPTLEDGFDIAVDSILDYE